MTRWWLLNGHRWADTPDAGPGPLVVCPVTLLLRTVEEGRPQPRPAHKTGRGR